MLTCLTVLASVCHLHGAGHPLNVLFILADDLGWSDLACYGADLHQTPNLDRLARQGVRFTQAYAMSVCSPTRAALLTGQHPARLHMTTWRESALAKGAEAPSLDRKFLPPATVSDLPLEATTVAELFKSAGYLTLHIGKWHLGDADHSPEVHGFDINVGGTHWGAPSSYFHPFSGPFGSAREFRYVPGFGVGKSGDYLTDRTADEAIRAIDAAGTRPFLMNLWFHSPHTPIEARPQLVAKFRKALKPGLHHQNPDYAAMIASLDDNIGRVLHHLDRRGLSDRTLVVFMSDNGGTMGSYKGTRVTDNAPLRSGKGSLYEGGIRVPLMVRFPGTTPRGAVCEEPVHCTDLMPTVAEAAGLAQTNAVDGLSLLPLLRNPTTHLDRDALFFHFPHYYSTTTPVSAVRMGDWKLLRYYEDNRVELFNLRSDPGETRDLVSEQSPKAEVMRARLDAWIRETGAQAPIVNERAPSR